MKHHASETVNEPPRLRAEAVDRQTRDATVRNAPACRGLEYPNGRHWSEYDPRFDLRAGYIELLQRWEWEWFVTLTFLDHTHPESARKKFGIWIDRVNRKAYGRRYRKRNVGVYWALATEYQKRGVIHFHAVLAATENIDSLVSRRWAKELWFQIEGIARVDKITHGQGAVSSYLAKYIAKDGDLELSKSLESYRIQLPLDALAAR